MPGNKCEHSLAEETRNNAQHLMCDRPVAFDQIAIARAVHAASKASKKMSTTSHVFDAQRESKVPRFSRGEIVLGDALGRGGFSDVYEVQRLTVKADNEKDRALECSNHMLGTIGVVGDPIRDDESEQSTKKSFQTAARRFTAEHCVRKKNGQGRYAIKYLSPQIMNDASSFQIGAADLITETMFLSSLEHPNIIKIRGICDQGLYGFASGLEGGFFILIDRLQETLESRLDKWVVQEKKSRRFLKKPSPQTRLKSFTERLQCALDVSAALAYLHSYNIVYRDLKPENIGFDCRGDVKIFDFGLATELHPQKHLEDGLYNLTGETGSLRYMAPEVAKDQPYNLTADVYSFAILLWELCSLKLPYKGMDRKSHSEHVVHGTYRPSIDASWSFPLRSLLTRGWNEDINKRPNMGSCYKMIRKEVISLRGGDANGIENSKRRSTYVLNPPSTGTDQNQASKAFPKAVAA